MDEQAAQLILINAPALSGAKYLSLLAQHGTAAGVIQAGPSAWRAAELSPRCCEFLSATTSTSVATQQRWLDHPSHHLIMLDDSRYPELLQQLPDPPVGLFVSGNPAVLKRPQLAMVGSRNPSPYGRQIAAAFAKHLSGCGLSITSGLAAGIDAASHRGALAGGGATLAVCGTGLDTIYPRSSEALAREIEATGALISEFPPGTPPRKHHFPQRNRLISGLSLGTLVVEAALHSGSLITARLAGDQGREVFAIPGSIHSPMSKGCHQLIRQGAKLVDDAADILSELGPLAASLTNLTAINNTELIDLSGFSHALLDKDYKILLDALGFEPLSVDQLVLRSGLPADAVISMLLILELDGCIECFPGGLYLRAQK
ncbi:MAG: DNA-processing protein DprA [Steroidobacteraceae bacterium]